MSFAFLRGFNLVVNDETSLHLEIEEMKLPALKEKSADFTPGGSSQETDVPLGVSEKLELPFKLATHNPKIKALYGLTAGARTPFTARQYIVDEQDENGKEIEVTVDIKGRLMQLEGEQMKGGEKSGYDHTISAVTWYQEIHDGKIMHEMNFWNGGWTVRNGIVINKTRNSILGVS